MYTARGHLIFAFSEDSAKRPFSPSCFISSATHYDIARFLPPQLLSLLAHLWPLANAPCRHSQSDFSTRWYDTHCPRQLAREGHTTKWHRQQGQRQWKLSCITSHGSRQTLPGYCIPEGLHCHQQSFSSTGILCALFSPTFIPFTRVPLHCASKTQWPFPAL